MKKFLGLFAVALLTIWLVVFASDRIASTSTAHAGSEIQPLPVNTHLSGKEAAPLMLSAQPVAFLAAGLVAILGFIMAVAPLLADDPALRREAGIYLRGDGLAHSPEGEALNRLPSPKHNHGTKLAAESE